MLLQIQESSATLTYSLTLTFKYGGSAAMKNLKQMA